MQFIVVQLSLKKVFATIECCPDNNVKHIEFILCKPFSLNFLR